MNRITLGIIGLGGAGRAHAMRFRKNRSVDRVVAYDPKQAQLPGVQVHTCLNEMLDAVDALSICTPDDTHYAYIERCLERGKHVLVEKPMVSSKDQAEKLGALLRRCPEPIFAVHHQMRFVPAFQKAKKLIEAGALGKIFYMEANYWHDMRKRNSMYDDWRIRGQGQSVIFGGACHVLDLLMYLNGTEVIEHNTYLNKNAYQEYPGAYTSATTTLKFADDVVAKCHSNNCVVYPQLNNLTVLGDEGSYIDGILYKAGRFRAVSDYFAGRKSVRLLEAVIHALPSHVSLSLLPKLPLFRANPFSAYNHEFACQMIVDNFIDAVIRDAPVLVGYEDGCRIIELCHETEADGLAGASPRQLAAAGRSRS